MTTQLHQFVCTDGFTASRRVIPYLEECMKNKAVMDTKFDENDRLSTEQEWQGRPTGASGGIRIYPSEQSCEQRPNESAHACQ